MYLLSILLLALPLIILGFLYFGLITYESIIKNSLIRYNKYNLYKNLFLIVVFHLTLIVFVSCLMIRIFMILIMCVSWFFNGGFLRLSEYSYIILIILVISNILMWMNYFNNKAEKGKYNKLLLILAVFSTLFSIFCVIGLFYGWNNIIFFISGSFSFSILEFIFLFLDDCLVKIKLLLHNISVHFNKIYNHFIVGLTNVLNKDTPFAPRGASGGPRRGNLSNFKKSCTQVRNGNIWIKNISNIFILFFKSLDLYLIRFRSSTSYKSLWSICGFCGSNVDCAENSCKSQSLIHNKFNSSDSVKPTHKLSSSYYRYIPEFNKYIYNNPAGSFLRYWEKPCDENVSNDSIIEARNAATIFAENWDFSQLPLFTIDNEHVHRIRLAAKSYMLICDINDHFTINEFWYENLFYIKRRNMTVCTANIVEKLEVLNMVSYEKIPGFTYEFKYLGYVLKNDFNIGGREDLFINQTRKEEYQYCQKTMCVYLPDDKKLTALFHYLKNLSDNGLLLSIGEDKTLKTTIFHFINNTNEEYINKMENFGDLDITKVKDKNVCMIEVKKELKSAVIEENFKRSKVLSREDMRSVVAQNNSHITTIEDNISTIIDDHGDTIKLVKKMANEKVYPPLIDSSVKTFIGMRRYSPISNRNILPNLYSYSEKIDKIEIIDLDSVD